MDILLVRKILFSDRGIEASNSYLNYLKMKIKV